MAVEQRGDDLSGTVEEGMVNRIYGGMRRGLGMVIESDRSRHTLDIRHFFYISITNRPCMYSKFFFCTTEIS